MLMGIRIERAAEGERAIVREAGRALLCCFSEQGNEAEAVIWGSVPGVLISGYCGWHGNAHMNWNRSSIRAQRAQ